MALGWQFRCHFGPLEWGIRPEILSQTNYIESPLKQKLSKCQEPFE